MQFRNIIVTLAAFLCIVAALPVSLHAVGVLQSSGNLLTDPQTRDELQLARREIDHDLTERGFGDKIINRLASTAKAVGGKNSNWDAITVEPSTLTKKFIEKVKKAVESYFDRNVSGINVK